MSAATRFEEGVDLVFRFGGKCRIFEVCLI